MRVRRARPPRPPGPGFWRRFFAPEVLFLIGTVLAISPYWLWYRHGPNQSYTYEISYIPLRIWLIGYVAFWIGARFAGKPRPPVPGFIRGHYGGLAWWMIAFIALQLVGVYRVYGGIPLLQFSRGVRNIFDVNMVQWGAFAGQFGLLFISLFFLIGVLMLVILDDPSRVPWRSLVILCGLGIEVVGTTFAGKRQGLVIVIVFLACGLALVKGHPVRPLLSVIRLPSSKTFARLIIVAIPIACIALFGYLATVRVGLTDGRDAVSEIVAYLQFPLINLEGQAEQAGYGPSEFLPMGLLRSLLPYRIVRSLDSSGQLIKLRPWAPEPTSGAGFYGELHWYLGLYGIIAFNLFVGWITKRWYNRSQSDVTALLLYSLCAWTLFAAHSYNHFFNLIFIPVPAVLFWLLGRMDRFRIRRPHRGATPTTARVTA